ncbi:MAG: CHAT domain-containing protein, partial [Gemmatimonadales bacterium]
LPRLPGASREARAVARFGKPAQVRLGADASEAFLKTAALEEYGVIHLATHALVDQTSAAGTRIILAPGEGEDGLLSAGDIARMNIGAGLVVLSACRSAAGQVVRGEGVQGLTAPFLQAGARSVLATQWAIDDRSGHRLIRDFYQGLAEGSTVGEALRGAKLAALDRGDPPAVWAAFTAVGDASVRVQAVTPQSWLSLGAVLLVLMVAGSMGAWVLWKRRA